MNIIWFRKDLRIDDNPALQAAIQAGAVKAIYIATPQQWQQHHGSAIQADFIERHLNLLAGQLSELGIEFQLLQADTYADIGGLLQKYCQSLQVEQVFVNSELEINEVQRDTKLCEMGIPLISFESDVIISKGKVVNAQGDMYRVFTPFKKAWLTFLNRQGLAISQPLALATPVNTSCFQPVTLPYPKQDSSRWPLVDEFWSSQVSVFFQHKITQYQSQRDLPAIKATSGMSPYLAIGALSPKRVLQQLLDYYPQLSTDVQHPAFSWLNELIWREFYRHLMYHYPQLSQDQNFKSQYDQLAWVNDPQLFEHWCNGTTGYPIIDAAMRQLLTIGWMHNRLRMLTASFLTKHLLIDWRWGQNYFSQRLIDHDLAANNGGWQWSASTGCDAQPYFRIFNPITQSERYDPQGVFIRRYLPELADVPDKHVHFPHQFLSQNLFGNNDYWPPIVEHSQARQRALAFYKQIKQEPS